MGGLICRYNEGGWTRIAYVNMTEPQAGWNQLPSLSLKSVAELHIIAIEFHYNDSGKNI